MLIGSFFCGNNSIFAFNYLPSFPSDYYQLRSTTRTVTLVQFISSLMFSKLYLNSNSIQLSIFTQSWSIVFDFYGKMFMRTGYKSIFSKKLVQASNESFFSEKFQFF